MADLYRPDAATANLVPHGAEAYREMLLASLPPGPAWDRAFGSVLYRLLSAAAEAFAQVEAKGWELLDELDPRTTMAMFEDWERLAGLPDPCQALAATFAQRRDVLIQKLTTVGGQSRAFFIALAKRIGFLITIDEFKPFTAGDEVELPVNSDAWHHAWRVNGPPVTIRWFLADENVAGDALAIWGNHLLECVLTRVKPAHTHLFFGYPDVPTIVRAEAPLWDGTLTNCLLHSVSGRIVPLSTLPPDSGWEVFDSPVPDPVASYSYAGAPSDMGFDVPAVRVTAVIGATAFPPGGTPDVQFEIDARLVAGSYDGFENWPRPSEPQATITGRYIKPRVTVDCTSVVAYLSTFTTTCEAPS